MRWRPFRSRAGDSRAGDSRAGDSREGGAPTDAGQARARARMVAEQLEARGIRDPELLDAFRRVERHAFVESIDPYGDRALPLSSGQTISQPYVVGAMTAAARPAHGWHGARVLEIGTGSGYQAAILAELGADVVSIERHGSLADEARGKLRAAGYETVEVIEADGTLGWPARAPYRSIIVTAAGPHVPKPLLEQLDPVGGKVVMPIGTREHQQLTIVERRGDDLVATSGDPVVFVPLLGEEGFPVE